MRKKALIYFAVLAVLWAAVAYVFRDSLIERAIERAASATWGARVEIDGLHVSLLKLHVSWDRLQITDRRDTWKNLLETGPAGLDVEARPLFWKRLIVREMTLKAVRSGTPRATDGRLPEPAGERKPGLAQNVGRALRQQLESLPVMNLSALRNTVEPARLVDVQALSSVRQYAELQQAADSTLAHWRARLEGMPIRQQLDSLEQDIARLKQAKPKNAVELARQLKQVQTLRDRVGDLRRQIQQTRKAMKTMLADLRQRLAAADRALQADILRAQKLARLGDLDISDVGLLLFGRSLVERYQQILQWIDTGRQYLPVAQTLMQLQKTESPPRFRGQDIPFPFHQRYPKFLIRRAALSAADQAADTGRVHWLRGELFGLTNEPAVYGEPTRFDLFVGSAAGNQYRLFGAIDHTRSEPRDTLTVEARQVALGRMPLGGDGFLPQAMVAERGDFRLIGIFIGERVNLQLELRAGPVRFEFSEAADGELAGIVRQALAGVQRLDLSARLLGARDAYRLQLSTNVDRLLGRRIKAVFDERLLAAREQVAQYVRGEADRLRRQVERLLQQQEQELQAKVRQWRARLDQRLADIEREKRDLEQRLKREKQKARREAEKKARDTLEKLFKKKKKNE